MSALKMVVVKTGDESSLDACIMFVDKKFTRKAAEKLAGDCGIKSPEFQDELELPLDFSLDDFGLYPDQGYTG